MNSLYVPKRVAEINDVGWGVCRWQLPNGGYIMDNDHNYLCSYGRTMDKVIEEKMRAAARSMGITDGNPQWLPGFRKISNDEHDNQMADLIDGGIPDPVDIWRQVNNG